MKKILIIEDDAVMADIYRDRFQSEGFETEVARDGDAAILKLKGSPPDLVMLDLMLPGVNGVEVLKFIRAQEATRTLPVIVLSNAYASGVVQAAWKAGANKCLTKSACGPKQLVGEVRDVLASTSTTPPGPVATPATAAASPPAGNAPAAAPSSGTNADTPATDLRGDTTSKMPERLAELRRLLHDLGKSDDTTRLPALLDLYRSVHGLAGSASLAGLTHIAQISCALEALLKELHARPQKINPSSLRTVAQAIDLLTPLSRCPDAPQDETLRAPLILVVDDEPISRETTCSAVEQAHLRAISLDDPALALKLLEENHFDLIFLDVQMPGLNGFDVCKKLHTTAANPNTPVVFVTSLNDFETRARSTLSGGIDFIGKPVLLIELAVKALTHLLRAQCKLAV